MSKEHVFFGKFIIKEKDGTDEYTVSAAPLSDKERDALAGIVRCRDCKCFSVDQSDHEYRSDWWCSRWYTDMVEPDGFCAWGVRREATK